MPVHNFFASPSLELVGWSLVHFVWQGAVLALLLAAALRLFRRSSAQARYVAGCATLALMAACPPATIAWLAHHAPANEAALTLRSTNPSALAPSAQAQPAEPPSTPSPPSPPRGGRVGVGGASVAVRSPPSSPPPQSNRERLQSLLTQAIAVLQPQLPWLVTFWLAGVALLSVRLAVGWLRIEHVRRRSQEPAGASWQAALSRMSARLGVTRAVRLVDSALVDVPTVIGWLRPVILLPATAVTGLSAAQVEALLAHELAHIRRHDYLVNLLQTALETLLFYHPAVWWVSSRIRQEREHCCDDAAIAACGDRAAYARALAVMEELRARPPALVAAASGGSLLERIRRIAGQPEISASPAGLWLAAALTLLLSLTISVGRAQVAEQPRTADRKTSAAAPVPNEAAAAQPETPEAPPRYIVGTVMSTDNLPLAGTKVVAWRQCGLRERIFVTDSAGQFQVPESWWKEPRFAGQLYILTASDSDRAFGSYQIVSSAAMGRSDGRPLDLPEPGPFQIRLAALERTVTGRILDPRQRPIAGARVQVESFNLGQNSGAYLYGFGMKGELPLPSTMTDEAGRFALKLPRNAAIGLQVLHPDWVVRLLETGDNDDFGDLAMHPAARIVGKAMLAGTGQPLANVLMQANRQNAMKSRQVLRGAPANRDLNDPSFGHDGACFTDANGNYEIGGLAPDVHDVYAYSTFAVNADSHLLAPHPGKVTLAAGKTETINVTFQRGQLVSGKVIEARTGKPLADIGVHAFVTQNADRSSSLVSHDLPKTNDRGEFRFVSLPGVAWLDVNTLTPEDWKHLPESKISLEIIPGQDPPPVVMKIEKRPAGFLLPPFVKHFSIEGGAIGGFDFDPQSSRLVLAGWTGGENDAQGLRNGTLPGAIQIWDLKGAAEVIRINGELGMVNDVAFSADGKAVAAGGRALAPANGGLLKVWDAQTGEVSRTIEGHSRAVTALAYSPDGKYLVSSGGEPNARVWDTATGTEVAVLKHDARPRSLRFSQDGRLLLTFTGVAGPKVWDTKTWEPQATTFEAPGYQLFGGDLSPDGRSVAVVGGRFEADGKSVRSDSPGLIQLFHVQSGLVRKSWNVDHQAFAGAAFTPDGRFLIENKLWAMIWDVEAQTEVGLINRRSGSSSDKIRVSPDGKLVAIGDSRGILLWDISALRAAGELGK